MSIDLALSRKLPKRKISSKQFQGVRGGGTQVQKEQGRKEARKKRGQEEARKERKREGEKERRKQTRGTRGTIEAF